MTKAKLRKLLTKPKFRAWLEAKKPRAVVGYTGEGTNCPVARYLLAGLSPKEDIYVFSYKVRSGEVGMRHPHWCADFIDRVDATDTGLSTPTRITASRALKILDGIK